MTRKLTLFAIFFIAINVHLTTTFAQMDPKMSATACPAAAEVTQRHLFGLWQLEQGGRTGAGLLRLTQSANHADGLGGRIERGGAQALVAGDVEDGEFNLEESTDGRRIDATWSGKVVEGSCGKEIRGTWTRAGDDTSQDFVLRRQSGWQ